jgi:hypothetical protein
MDEKPLMLYLAYILSDLNNTNNNTIIPTKLKKKSWVQFLTDEHQLVFFSNSVVHFFFIQYCRDLFFEYKNGKKYIHSLNKSQQIKELTYKT